MMDDYQFDKLIKRKLREDPLIVPEANLDHLINKALQKVNRPKWKSFRILTAAIIVFGFLTTVSILLQREPEQAKKSQINTINKENEIEKAVKIAVVDINKEKTKLASEGYTVEPRTGLPEGYNGSSSALINRDMAYISTLKDVIYNTNSTIKGKVLGIKYFIHRNTAFTKAKILVEESYTGSYKPGDIVTIVKTGAIITHYEMIVMEGIDQKFNIPESELEQAKQKMVVHDNFQGEMVFPDETMIVFIGKKAETNEKNDEAYYVGEPIIKFHEEKILPPQSTGMEESYIFDEFSFTEQLDVLEDKIHKIAIEKEGFTYEKARKAALNSLLEQDKHQIINLDEATVRYSSQGAYLNAEKTPENVIIVTFELKNNRVMRVILSEKDYQLYKIVK
jgi:hypothetical protein